VGYAASRVGVRSWQEQLDSAPPLSDNRIRGGTRTLDLQALCPMKAFCVARLGAEPLEAPVRGLDPRLRGILIHRVLELLLDPDASGAPFSRVAASIEIASGELITPGDACWRAQVGAERMRLESMLHNFLELEASRDSFTTAAVEDRTEITIKGSRLKCRIDRLDRLANGTELVIDYKTGRAVPNRWFEARLSDCQLPLYAQDTNAAGIATIRLGSDRIEYRAAGTDGISLPGAMTAFDEAGWQTQVGRWRGQIEELISEFISGDVRLSSDAGDFVGSDAREHVGGSFAPLSRVGDGR